MSAMTSEKVDLKVYLTKGLEAARKHYVEDMEAMDHEQLAKSPGGVARSPYDMTYEVMLVNDRIAMRIRGEDPGPWTMEGWVTAPAEFQTKEVAIAKLAGSIDSIIGAVKNTPDEKLTDKFTLPSGETSVMELATFASFHTHYHDAQLN